ncbi:MAG TPA: hypothetical protein VGG10_23365 [Rhizomicrobium sp.]|jgi:ElaB/YqjD/DUF883 family membrane-anchored ribosome-binding protein
MSNATERDFDSLLKEFAKIREDMAKITESVQATVRNAGGEALNEAREAGRRAWAHAEDHADTVMEQIEKNPLQAALIAFAIGAFLGFLFGGRRNG